MGILPTISVNLTAQYPQFDLCALMYFFFTEHRLFTCVQIRLYIHLLCHTHCKSLRIHYLVHLDS